MDKESAIYKFRIWYVDPIKKLEELPDGGGGFVAFIVGLALYERLIHARLKLENQKTSPEAIKRAMSADLGLSDHQRSVFWDVFRDGLLHQAMPKSGRTGYFFRDDFSDRPVFTESDGKSLICINPWKFTHRVLNEFLSEPDLILASDSFPLASIIYQTKGQVKFIA